MPADEDRKKLLSQMYDQMFNDINRHIMVVWQSVGVLIGAFAILALAEKGIVNIDIGATLILLIAGWLLAHLYDAGYWYNRNLAIIANIEKEFLYQADLRNIHYYFGTHRPNNKMITHLHIQYILGVGIALVVLAFHFMTRVVPGFSLSIEHFDLQRALPYLILVPVAVYLKWLRDQRNRSYAEFLKNSPGKTLDTSDIQYGEGHGFHSKTSITQGSKVQDQSKTGPLRQGTEEKS